MKVVNIQVVFVDIHCYDKFVLVFIYILCKNSYFTKNFFFSIFDSFPSTNYRLQKVSKGYYTLNNYLKTKYSISLYLFYSNRHSIVSDLNSYFFDSAFFFSVSSCFRESALCFSAFYSVASVSKGFSYKGSTFSSVFLNFPSNYSIYHSNSYFYSICYSSSFFSFENFYFNYRTFFFTSFYSLYS